jgi:hypothetical protein
MDKSRDTSNIGHKTQNEDKQNKKTQCRKLKKMSSTKPAVLLTVKSGKSLG